MEIDGATLKKLLADNEVDVVIDPCFGSGSTARACQELGRNFYGFEINKEFYRRAKEEMLLKPDDMIGKQPSFDFIE